ncbi:hypothetical protein [Megamonas funiformis]|uniref:hypothetical protein n=1 Tax=Megamonas funiformis TaxID=437897 RepID=UPI003F7FA7B0
MARIYGSTNNSNWGLFVDLNETSYSVGNNNSNVRASVYLYRTSSASYYGGSATIGVSVNGEYKSTGFYPSYPTNIGAGEGNAHLVATFDYTVPHNADGSKTVSMSMSWSADFSPSSGSASGSISLTNIPRQANILTAPDFNDEENPTITYSNSAGNSVSSLQACISLTGSADDIEYRDISKTGSSYTFELTDAERNLLRNATLSGSTQRQVIFFVKTEIGGNTYYSTLTRTLTIVNCSPTVTATIEDINTATLEITGSSSTIVKGYSKAKITPTAAAKKGASITSIKVNDTVVSKESIELSGTNKYEVRAYDNRGLVASKDLVGGTDFTFINYIPLTFSGTLERHTPTGNQLDLSFSGNYFNGSFGTTDNSLTIKWYWKEKNAAEWTLGGTLVKDTDFVINNNVYHSGTAEEETKISLGNIFDYKKTYEIKIEYSDALLKNNSITLLGRKGKPVYNWGRDFFNINGELRINNTKFIQEEYNELHDKTYSCSYLNNLNSYSTDEIKIGRWIDGKPLYQKVILYTGDISSTIDNQHSHGIENVDTIFVKFAFIQSTGNERLAYSLPVTQYGSNTAHDELSVVINRTKYQFLVQSGWSGKNWHAHIIVNYTKTTDSVANLMVEDETKTTG